MKYQPSAQNTHASGPPIYYDALQCLRIRVHQKSLNSADMCQPEDPRYSGNRRCPAHTNKRCGGQPVLLNRGAIDYLVPGIGEPLYCTVRTWLLNIARCTIVYASSCFLAISSRPFFESTFAISAAFPPFFAMFLM